MSLSKLFQGSGDIDAGSLTSQRFCSNINRISGTKCRWKKSQLHILSVSLGNSILPTKTAAKGRVERKGCAFAKLGLDNLCVKGEPSDWGTFVRFQNYFWFVPCVFGRGEARGPVLVNSVHLKFQTTVSAVLSHMFPSMTAHGEGSCGELLLTDVANPPAKVKIRGMVLLLRQLQLHAKSLFQQRALNKP